MFSSGNLAKLTENTQNKILFIIFASGENMSLKHCCIIYKNNNLFKVLSVIYCMKLLIILKTPIKISVITLI